MYGPITSGTNVPLGWKNDTEERIAQLEAKVAELQHKLDLFTDGIDRSDEMPGMTGPLADLVDHHGPSYP